MNLHENKPLIAACASAALKVYDRQNFGCDETDIAGFYDGCTLSFEGTNPKSFHNWLTDARIAFLVMETPLGFIRVHTGFWNALDSVWDDVRYMTPVQVTGHSLGGALARLFCLRRHIEGLPVPSSIITFGEPRSMDALTARMADGICPSLRIVHECDIVPRVPVCWWIRFYRHTTDNLFLDSVGNREFNMPEWKRIPSDGFDFWQHWKLKGLGALEELVTDHRMEDYAEAFCQ